MPLINFELSGLAMHKGFGRFSSAASLEVELVTAEGNTISSSIQACL